jgi:hypothetical protein
VLVSDFAVGYCILLAQPLAAALEPLAQPWLGGASSEDIHTGSGNRPGGSPQRPLRRARAMAAAVFVALLLAFYAGKTVLRNQDWRDEERLFRAAQKVRRWQHAHLAF